MTVRQVKFERKCKEIAGLGERVGGYKLNHVHLKDETLMQVIKSQGNKKFLNQNENISWNIVASRDWIMQFFRLVDIIYTI